MLARLLALLTLLTLATLATFAAPPAAAKPCRLQGLARDWYDLPVQPESGPTFALRLERATVDIALDADSARDEVTVSVSSPLAFEARVPLAAVPLGVRRAGRLSPFVTASASTWLVADAIAGDRLRAHLDLGPKWRIDPVEVPCDTLVLRPSRRDDEVHASPAAVRWRGPVLSLYASPGRGAVFTLVERAAPAPEEARRMAELPLTELRRGRGWTEVEARFSEGTRVRGWVSNDQLSTQLRLSPMGKLAYGRGACITSSAERRVTLRPDAPIYDAQAGRLWAHVPPTPPSGVYAVSGADGWSQLTRIPGLLPNDDALNARLEVAWIRTSDLVTSDR